MTTTKTFNVKDGSLNQFFLDNALGVDRNNRDSMRHFQECTPFNLMNDEILLKKSDTLQPGRHVVFELEDRGQQSGKDLVNRYEYHIYQYDDVSVKLVLLDFKVKYKPKKP